MTEFTKHLPQVKEPLISERDRYMASRLRKENADSRGRKVLVLIGAGHMEGLASHLETGSEDPQSERQKLEAMPP